jgi:DNA-binding IclR family transcriptional regulator
MSGSVLQKISYLDVCRPYLLQLRDSSKESSFLAILDGAIIVVIDWEPSRYNAQINIMVGKTVPAHCTGAGRAILAFLPEEELESLLQNMALNKFTENTVTDIKTFTRILRETRRRGYDVSKAEYDRHLTVVAAPIFNIHNRVIASCAIAALESRVKDDEQIEEYGRMVKAASVEISKKLGSSINLQEV